MKINVGIVGFGNLGKSLAEEIKQSDEFNLVAIFSRRNIKGTISYKKISSYKDKIQLLFLCGGSQNELELQALKNIKHFNIIECYDNHAKLNSFENKLNRLAQKNKKIALCSFGWDPGLFSLMRGIFDSLGYTPYTFWGKGMSQGHTQAIKQIDGVLDAMELTIPCEKIKKQIKSGAKITPSHLFHQRLCFVVSPKDKQKTVRENIINMPHYFKGYKTKVHFVCQKKLDRIKTLAHQGEVLTQNNVLNFSLKLPSNPKFTSKVMVCFARAFRQISNEKKYGAFTIFDFPIGYILKKNKFEYL